MDAVANFDSGLDEAILQLVIRTVVDPEREVVQHTLFLVPGEIFVRVRMRDQHDHLGYAARLRDHQELVRHLGRRDYLEPELVAIELQRRLHVGDPQHDLGEPFHAAHAATAVTIAARFVSRTRGGTEQPGAISSPRPPVSSMARRASASIFGGGP